MARQHIIGTHATTVRSENGNTYVRYHQTDVVVTNANTITLNTGGHRSSTTKTRMNQVSNQLGLGYHVYQSKGDWFVDYKGKTYTFETESVTLDR